MLHTHTEYIRHNKYQIVWKTKPTEAVEPLKELCHALQDKMLEVKLKEDNMRRDLMKELDTEREEIYNEGVKHGRNLLAQLNSGEITVRELNERQVYKKTKEE